MLQKSWNAVTLICGNHKKDHSHPMKLQQGLILFSFPARNTNPFMEMITKDDPAIIVLH